MQRQTFLLAEHQRTEASLSEVGQHLSEQCEPTKIKQNKVRIKNRDIIHEALMS